MAVVHPVVMDLKVGVVALKVVAVDLGVVHLVDAVPRRTLPVVPVVAEKKSEKEIEDFLQRAKSSSEHQANLDS